MTYEFLLTDDDGSVRTITLNRPAQLNALSQAVIRELSQALAVIRDDSSVRAVIITGAGDRAFAAGADISELAEAGSAAETRMLAERSHELGRAIADLPKPVIAAINGFALGGGLELALACDIRIAADSAQVGLPEISLGIMPGWGGTQRLPRLAGAGQAKLMMLTGDRIKADDALGMGIVERVVPAADLRAATLELAQRMAAQPPLSIAAIKRAVNRGLDMPLNDANMLEADLFAELSTSEDAREGTHAFLEKRKASWKGR